MFIEFSQKNSIISVNKNHESRGGARGGLGAISQAEHANPPSESEKRFFFGDFWHL